MKAFINLSALRRTAVLTTVTAMVAGLVGVSALPAAADLTWVTQVSDGFSRSLGSSWGSADKGGSYTTTIPPGAAAKTAGGVGSVTGLKTGHTFTAALKSLNLGDVQATDTLVVTSSASQFDYAHGLSVRQQASGSSYSFRVRVNQSGSATLAVSRVVGSASTWLTGVKVPATLKTGQRYRMQVEVTGTSPVSMRARAWAEGSTQPGWQVQYSDSSSQRISGSGSVAAWSYVYGGSSALSLSRDDLVVAGAATSSPGATTPTPVSSSRGANFPTSAYAAPSNALFVNPGSGSDSAAGTKSAPLRTAQAAVNKASSGRTVVLRGGTYHESVTIPSGKSLTLQNYPGETVWFDGSVPVTSWSKSGSTWVSSGWTKEFSSSMGGSSSFKARFIDRSYSMAAHPDQVFLNGTALRQVASAGAVSSGTFYVDNSQNKLVVGSDPFGKEVRASDLSQAMVINSTNTTIQGMGFRRYATAYEKRGTVKMDPSGGTFRDLVVSDNATIGMALSNAGKLIDRVTVERNGMLGIGINQADGLVIRGSSIKDNNVEHFKQAPVSGGIKITRTRTLKIDSNDVTGNRGMGIWLDESCYRFIIVNNLASRNTNAQIQAELSQNGIIANNEATDGEAGINIYNTGDVKVFNNDLAGNSLFGLKLFQDARRQSNASLTGHDPRRPIPDPDMSWLTRNITVANNAFGNGGAFQVYALDTQSNVPADKMNLTFNGNLFNKRVLTSQPTMVAWGQGDNTTLIRYETPAALASAKNSSWKNAQTISSLALSAMSVTRSSAGATAVPLPSDVANAVGSVFGLRLVGAVL